MFWSSGFMCQKCVDAVKEHLPLIPESKIGELLFICTSYPFGSRNQIKRNVLELQANTDGSFSQCIEYASEQLNAEYTKYKNSNQASQ